MLFRGYCSLFLIKIYLWSGVLCPLTLIHGASTRVINWVGVVGERLIWLNFTFHDLRHEAISRMFEKGLDVLEVISISGHKTASQLFRYVQVNGMLLA